ncbi:hypothetical protein [Pseudonocardia nigra]|uniref:hypothetical protein n=1 Tax=Pseudonocardia nigra TaxID=1921578 RepID=UPI001C5F65DB|nr:hypothetical protein [Pseudonocardia nigra]
MDELAFTVHVTRADISGGVEVIFQTERDARAFAKSRSQDQGVLSASVTGFLIGVFGSRQPVAWYSDGNEQPPRYHGSKRQFYPT